MSKKDGPIRWCLDLPAFAVLRKHINISQDMYELSDFAMGFLGLNDCIFRGSSL